MQMKRVKNVTFPLFIAIALWTILAGLGLLFWYGMASDCCSDIKYFHGVARLRGEANLGWLTQDEAERRIAEMHQAYLRFVWDTAKLPLLVSMLAIPIIALLLARSSA